MTIQIFIIIIPTFFKGREDSVANCGFKLVLPYTLRKKGTKAVTGAVHFQKVKRPLLGANLYI